MLCERVWGFGTKRNRDLHVKRYRKTMLASVEMSSAAFNSVGRQAVGVPDREEVRSLNAMLQEREEDKERLSVRQKMKRYGC